MIFSVAVSYLDNTSEVRVKAFTIPADHTLAALGSAFLSLSKTPGVNLLQGWNVSMYVPDLLGRGDLKALAKAAYTMHGSKIDAIKEVRAAVFNDHGYKMGLKESKDLVDSFIS